MNTYFNIMFKSSSHFKTNLQFHSLAFLDSSETFASHHLGKAQAQGKHNHHPQKSYAARNKERNRTPKVLRITKGKLNFLIKKVCKNLISFQEWQWWNQTWQRIQANIQIYAKHTSRIDGCFNWQWISTSFLTLLAIPFFCKANLSI